MSQRKPYAPWRRHLQFGTAFLVTGAASVYCAIHAKPPHLLVLLAGLAQLCLAGMLLKTGLIRWSGKQVELSATRSLRLPDQWECKPNYRLSTGGDIDIYIEAPNGDRFAVEIKSFESLEVHAGFMGFGDPKVTDASGRRLREDPIPQTQRNAEAVLAKPVLWLPKASGKTRTLRNGVTIVYGSKKSLLKAIGARVGWSII